MTTQTTPEPTDDSYPSDWKPRWVKDREREEREQAREAAPSQRRGV